MKRIYIIRHAKSSWSDLSLDDFDRPLKKRGKEDIKNIAQWLKKEGIKPDKVISSPAKRAVKTLKILETVLNIKKNIINFDKNIYEAHVGYLIKMIEKLDNRYNNVFIIGHNPSLSELSEYFTDTIITNIPTSGVMAIEFEIKKWSEIKNKKGKILFFIYPKKLKDKK